MNIVYNQHSVSEILNKSTECKFTITYFNCICNSLINNIPTVLINIITEYANEYIFIISTKWDCGNILTFDIDIDEFRLYFDYKCGMLYIGNTISKDYLFDSHIGILYYTNMFDIFNTIITYYNINTNRFTTINEMTNGTIMYNPYNIQYITMNNNNMTFYYTYATNKETITTQVVIKNIYTMFKLIMICRIVFNKN